MLKRLKKIQKNICESRIVELKRQLSDTDYKVIKCSEYSLAGEPAPYDIEALHKERQSIRDEINALEAKITVDTPY